MLQNAYFLAKIGADTAENEQHFAEMLPIGRRVADRCRASRRTAAARSGKKDRRALLSSREGLSQGSRRGRPWPPQLLADCGKQLRLATIISLSELVCADEERRRATLLTEGLRIFRETFQSYPP